MKTITHTSLSVIVTALVAVLSSATPASAAFVWDGSGSPTDAGFADETGGLGFTFDTPVTGQMTQDSPTTTAKFRHYGPGLDLDNSAGWFIETRFEFLSGNDTDDGFGASVFLRNATGTFATMFLSDGTMNVWDGASIVNVDPPSYGGADGQFHTVRVETVGGADVELLVDGTSVNTYTMQGGTGFFLSFGDHSGGVLGAVER